MKRTIFAILLFLLFANSAFAECDTSPPYWCNDGSYAKNLTDAIQQNNSEWAATRTQQQHALAEQERLQKIQENLKWLNENEGRRYVSVSQHDAMQACILKTLMMGMFTSKAPARGERADPVCQKSAQNALEVGHYESLAFYRKENKIKPPRKGADNLNSQESVAAREYTNKRFEADLKTLAAGDQKRLKSLNASIEVNAKLCAKEGDARACHDMVSKPFMAAFKEILGGSKMEDVSDSASSTAMPAATKAVVAEIPTLPPMPTDLKLPENSEYDPYATQKWTCKLGFVQVGNGCQKP